MKKKSRFKIGTKVRVKKNYQYGKAYCGLVGVVKELNHIGVALVGVYFKGRTDGHALDGKVTFGTGWYFSPKDLTVIKTKKKVKKARRGKK